MRTLAFPLLALAAPAFAQSIPFPGPGGVAGAPAGYIGPGDVLSGAVAWYGLRAYSAAAASANLKAILVGSTSHSNETCDILLATGGGLGVTNACSGADSGIALASFCTSNADCVVTELYDQSGNVRHAPANTVGCTLSISPLKMLCGSGNEYSSALTVSVPQPATASYVAQRTSGTTTFNTVISFDNGPSQAGFNNSSGNLFIYGGTTAVPVTYVEGTQGAVQETFDGAASVIDFNGTSTTGLNPGVGSPTTAVIGLTGGSASAHDLFGSFWEAGVWQGTAANHINFPYASMTSNQRTYWGF